MRGLESHLDRGTDQAIQRAITLIQQTHTRRPPDYTSSDETDRDADESSSFHGFTSEDSLEEIHIPSDVEEADRPAFLEILRTTRANNAAKFDRPT